MTKVRYVEAKYDSTFIWDIEDVAERNNFKLEDIENPKYPDRTQWVHDLGYKMWSIKEIRDGTVYKRFKSKLGL